MKGHSGSSMLTFVVLPHMYVADILHDTRVAYKLLTLGQPVVALDDFGMSLPRIDLGADTTSCVSKAGDIVGNDICLLVS